MTDPHAEDLSGTLADRGIHDVASGLALARADFVDFRHSLVDVVRGDFSQVSMGLLALITRAQGFFDGALKGIEDDNPYATFPLRDCCTNR